MFKRGYAKHNERLKEKSKYLASCETCKKYYQAVGDKEELCQDPQVLEYDVIVEDRRTYCYRWKCY